MIKTTAQARVIAGSNSELVSLRLSVTWLFRPTLFDLWNPKVLAYLSS
jgi:hypothetical protein